MMRSIPFQLIMLLTFFAGGVMQGQITPDSIPAFPGAEGFGAFTSGGRGGAVIEVTNLNDDGPGSLREAIKASGPRTVVFRVSGTIQLRSRLSIKNNDITIAGQTAPGDGICLRDYEMVVDADNVIIRFMRFRLGDVTRQEHDAINGREQKNIIIDHCSMSWSIDECASFYDNENFTMQWCVISESLWDSYHSKGEHGYGGIWGGKGASFHHNLLAHHTSRNPRFNGSRYHGDPAAEIVDFRNNVIFNWGFNSAYGGEEGNHNLVNNYYKAGPATSSGEKQYRINNPSSPYGKWYVSGNYTFGYPDATADNWTYGIQGPSATEKDAMRADTPFQTPPIIETDALTAFDSIMKFAGAIKPLRDPVDERIVSEAISGKVTYGATYGGGGKGIINSQAEVGGWPELQTYGLEDDSDQDGMPNSWETARGLNPEDPEDRNLVAEGELYTNLELFLNEKAVQKDYLFRPVNLTATYIDPPAFALSWTDLSNGESSFTIERSISSGFEEIGNVGPGISAFTDTDIENALTYTYRVRAFNDTLVSSYSDTVSVSIPTGVRSYEMLQAVSGYPNPVTEIYSLHINSRSADRIGTEIYAVNGSMVASTEMFAIHPGQNLLELDMRKFQTGIYIIRVFHENGTQKYLKVIKK